MFSEPVDSALIYPGGHRWRRCSFCHAWALTLDSGGRCRQGSSVREVSAEGLLSVSCPGKVVDVDTAARPSTAKRQAIEGCSRPGCGNGAAITTAMGERVCWRCLAEMARGPVRNEAG